MNPPDTWFLPEWAADWSSGRPLGLRAGTGTPTVTSQGIEAVAGGLWAESAALSRRPVAEFVAALDAAAARWLDAGDPLRRAAEAWLPRITGYAPLTVRESLDHLFGGLRADPLNRLLRGEIGEPDALDRFIPRGAGAVRALGPKLTVLWASGNVPVASIPTIFHALLLKSPCLVKASTAEPLLPALVARSLAESAPWLAGAVAALSWPGDEEALGRAALRHADAVVAYGGADALAAARGWAPPEARFRACGPRVGFGVVGREQLFPEALEDLAARAARDVALFDQQGCMSPHLLYVEEGGAVPARELAARIAAALAGWESRAPRRPLDPAEAAAVHQLRAAHEMRAFADPETALFASPEGTAWSVLLDPEPAFRPSCLNRVLRVTPIADLARVPDLVAPFAAHLQTVVAALDAARLAALAERLASLGVTRIAPLGRAQEPDLTAPHDGYPRLADLVRWITIEAAGSP
jgi:hypothetical protein